MKKRDSIAQQKYELGLRIRAEASVIRARWLNEVLPAVEAEFDRRVTTGESTTLIAPNVNDLIADAIKQIGPSASDQV